MGRMALAACVAALLVERGNTAVELLLRITSPGPGLEAELVNRSSAEHSVLRSSDLQPVRLVLKDASGREVTPFDERTRRKFDRSVSRGMYVKAPPGRTLPLEKGNFRRLPDGRYELRWGPFTYREIQPGSWKVRAEFDSAIDYVTEKGHRVTVAGVWKGRAVSAELDVTLESAGR